MPFLQNYFVPTVSTQTVPSGQRESRTNESVQEGAGDVTQMGHKKCKTWLYSTLCIIKATQQMAFQMAKKMGIF